jgi:hypothetical protein
LSSSSQDGAPRQGQPQQQYRQCSHDSNVEANRHKCCNPPTAAPEGAGGRSDILTSETEDSAAAVAVDSGGTKTGDGSSALADDSELSNGNAKRDDCDEQRNDDAAVINDNGESEAEIQELDQECSAKSCSSPDREPPTVSSCNKPDVVDSQPCLSDNACTSTPSSPRNDATSLGVGDSAAAAADSISNNSVAIEGYTSESSATVATCCADEDIYDTVGGSSSASAEARFVESQEKICKFFDDDDVVVGLDAGVGGLMHGTDVKQSALDVTAFEGGGSGDSSAVVRDVTAPMCSELMWDSLRESDLCNGYYYSGRF